MKQFDVNISVESLSFLEDSQIGRFVSNKCGVSVYKALTQFELYRSKSPSPQWLLLCESNIKFDFQIQDYLINLIKYSFLYFGKKSVSRSLTSLMTREVNNFLKDVVQEETSLKLSKTCIKINDQRQTISNISRERKKLSRDYKKLKKEQVQRKKRANVISRINSKNASGERSCSEMKQFLLQLIADNPEIKSIKGLKACIKEGVNEKYFIRTGDELVHEDCCCISLKNSALSSRMRKLKTGSTKKNPGNDR